MLPADKRMAHDRTILLRHKEHGIPSAQLFGKERFEDWFSGVHAL